MPSSELAEGRWVLRALRTLPPEQRIAAALFYDGMSCEEITDLLGKPATTVAIESTTRSQDAERNDDIDRVLTPGIPSVVGSH
jgi:DNA-directed RNA polymerase specialized sigma24 family protein